MRVPRGARRRWPASCAGAGRAAGALRRSQRRAHRHGHPPARSASRTRSARVPRSARCSSGCSAHGLVDVGRAVDPDNDDLFTWWAPWRNLRQRNIGWRIDYVLASDALHARTQRVRRPARGRHERSRAGDGDASTWMADVTPCVGHRWLCCARRRLAACRGAASSPDAAFDDGCFTHPALPTPGSQRAAGARHPFVRRARRSARHARRARSRADFTARRLRRPRDARHPGAPGASRARPRHARSRHPPGDRRRRHTLAHALGAADRRSSAARSPSRCRPSTTRIIIDYATSAERAGAAVAVAGTDGRQDASVSVLAGPGDPHAHVDSDAGQPGHPPDLRGAHHRAAPARGGDERRAAHADGVDGRRADTALSTSACRSRSRRICIALAVGDLAFRPLGPRTGVYAEPLGRRRGGERVRRHSRRWSRPPRRCTGRIAGAATTCSCCRRRFPFGGMENPRLTFATPTILAGDRSLDVARRARARALVVGQPRHQRDVERLLAERRLHGLLRAAHHGSALRRRARRDARGARPPRADRRDRAGRRRRRRTRSSTSISTGRDPDDSGRTRSPTKRARRC